MSVLPHNTICDRFLPVFFTPTIAECVVFHTNMCRHLCKFDLESEEFKLRCESQDARIRHSGSSENGVRVDHSYH